MSKDNIEVPDEKVIEATRTAEEMMESIKNGELGDLFERVQAAQKQIQSIKTGSQGNLSAHDVVSLTSVILSDMIRLVSSEYSIPSNTQIIIDAVIRAGTIQHGRMLGVQFAEGEKS